MTNGKLVYIKPTKHAGGAPLPYDVYSYSKASQSFPHESTSDQWFSESQFESYRALGRHAVAQILGDDPLQEFHQLFERAQKYVSPPVVVAQVIADVGLKPDPQRLPPESPAVSACPPGDLRPPAQQVRLR